MRLGIVYFNWMVTQIDKGVFLVMWLIEMNQPWRTKSWCVFKARESEKTRSVIEANDSRSTGEEVRGSEVKGQILWVVTFRLWPPQRFTVLHPRIQRLENTSRWEERVGDNPFHNVLTWEVISWNKTARLSECARVCLKGQKSLTANFIHIINQIFICTHVFLNLHMTKN